MTFLPRNYLKQISNKEKYKIVQGICNVEKANKQSYLLAKQSKSGYIKEAVLEPDNKLERVLNLLEETNKLIIENDFINKYTDKDWYEQYFCKSSYYKHKNNAVEEFLYYYLNS
ncbi:MG284/MPN403 family protein [Mycoplasmopsis meleagridis]|uniref:MG284/MPN403 family protein n=1 Tax=Mycoplasmopsis meleagridis TaxID=29561 RepID=UPI00073D4325|nr:hypothetical protein [Mycoplasmopsis meleagridis]KUH47639.1 hypothetical protein ASB56_00690 [Mycoplasmopsis meleagridis]